MLTQEWTEFGSLIFRIAQIQDRRARAIATENMGNAETLADELRRAEAGRKRLLHWITTEIACRTVIRE